MRARYLIILTAVVLGLVVASPVSAFYSLSVSGMSANPAFSPGFQSPLKDFSRQDAIPDEELSEIVWRSVRGAESPMPPPVRSAFVRVVR